MAVCICPWMGGISQRARDGDANMSKNGRYLAKSQGWRCAYAQGWANPKTPKKPINYTLQQG